MTRMKGASLEKVVGDLSFPTSLAFDSEGRLYVAESGLPFGGAPDRGPAGGRVLRIDLDSGRAVPIAEGLRHPVNGLTPYDDGFLLAEGGSPGRVSRLSPSGERTTLVDGLPGAGNYHTNMAVAGPDGWIYFSVGAMTNLGVVGLDGGELAWLRKVDHSWDVPGMSVVLTGENFTTPAMPPFSSQVGGACGMETAVTGAFSPFGTSTEAGQRVPAGMPCTAAMLRCRPDGSGLELFAWGLRNAYGLGFAPDGRLLATDQGSDDRGSRPIGGVPELVYEVRRGAWYGWPDFVGGVPVTDPRFRPSRGEQPRFLLANHDELPPPERPVARLPVNSAAVKFDFAPPGSPWPGQMLVALFGDERPMTAPLPPEGAGARGRVGRSVVRVDLRDGSFHPLLTEAEAEGLLRPIDVRVSPDGEHLYVADFGHFEMRSGGRVEARAASGAVWRVPLAPWVMEELGPG